MQLKYKIQGAVQCTFIYTVTLITGNILCATKMRHKTIPFILNNNLRKLKYPPSCFTNLFLLYSKNQGTLESAEL